jgi:DNA-binding MarR family transcriptional regulator
MQNIPVTTTSRTGGRAGRHTPELDKQAVSEIVRTTDGLRRRFAAILEPHGLTPQQFNVLRILRGARPDPLPTMEIAERMLEKTPGITGLLDRLEAKGLIERRRLSDDRRCVYGSITPAGLELLAELDEPVADGDAAAVRGLPAAELARLVDLLRELRAGWTE